MENDPKIIRSKENPGFKHNPNLSLVEQEEIICQGAEGRIYLSELWGTPCIVKERFKKEYRVPALDEQLTKQRIK
jgi:TP53 regulating kinase-like protein